MELIGIVAWYAAGFAGATVLIRHGHSRTVMWFSAALVGGLLVLPALVALARRSHAVQHHGRSEKDAADQKVPTGPSGPLRRRSNLSGRHREPATLALSAQVPDTSWSDEVLLALLDVDDDGAVVDAACRLRQPGELVIVVGRVGHEASTPWLDTGELDRVDEQLGFARRRIADPCRTLVSSGTLCDLVSDAADGLKPRVLVAPADGHGRHRQVELRRIAADLACPLLLVPSRTVNRVRAVSA